MSAPYSGRDWIKNSVIYSFFRNRKERIKKLNRLKEIHARVREGNLLKDLTNVEMETWLQRIAVVRESADNQKINCVASAGKLKNDVLVLHNGVVMDPLGYYNYPMLKMLMENKGIHEPQEEYAFQEVLKEMPAGATMIELGAYWSFYSMWFNKAVAGARNYMIEPETIESGIEHFRLNKLHGEFFRYYISDKPGQHANGIPETSVDHFVKKNNIDFVDILHSDIQGNELLMLQGAINLLSAKKVGYLFISTHSDALHAACTSFLDKLDYLQVCSADMQETYSVDGLLLYKNPAYKGISKIEISLKGNDTKIPTGVTH